MLFEKLTFWTRIINSSLSTFSIPLFRNSAIFYARFKVYILCLAAFNGFRSYNLKQFRNDELNILYFLIHFFLCVLFVTTKTKMKLYFQSKATLLSLHLVMMIVSSSIHSSNCNCKHYCIFCHSFTFPPHLRLWQNKV